MNKTREKFKEKLDFAYALNDIIKRRAIIFVLTFSHIRENSTVYKLIVFIYSKIRRAAYVI